MLRCTNDSRGIEARLPASAAVLLQEALDGKRPEIGQRHPQFGRDLAIDPFDDALPDGVLEQGRNGQGGSYEEEQQDTDNEQEAFEESVHSEGRF